MNLIGLIYREGGLIDDAISLHEKSLALMKRPDTEFYLSILYFLKGDSRRGKLMALTADDDLNQKDYTERLRPVWKILIHCGIYIIDDDQEEALRIIQT